MAQTELRAAIILSNPALATSASVRGNVHGGPPENTLLDSKQYRVDVASPPGGPFALSASPPPGTTTIDGASSTANAMVDATFTLNAVLDTLVVSSIGSTTIALSAGQSATRVTVAEASGIAGFGLGFVIDQSYDYEITSSLSASGQAPPPQTQFAAASFIVVRGNDNNFSFERSFFADSGASGHGASVGTLEPGDYLVAAQAAVGDTAFNGMESSNADYQFTLRLIPSGVRWSNPIGGTFGDPLNWFPQQVPEKSVTRSDTALFDLNNNYPVDIDSARTVERLVVRHGTVDFNNNILTVAATSPTVPSVSIENDGRLNIATGGLRSVHAIIGNAPPVDPANPPTAEVLVANVNQGWQLTGNLAVGGAGKGRLFVANGGLVGSASSTIGGPFGGEAVVGGHDSRWTTGNLAVGSGGNGSLTIEAGAEVESGAPDSGIVGFTVGAVGEVTVTGIDATDGSSSSWTTGLLTVGRAGATGGLNILDGGVVSAAGLVVADAPGSVGRVVVSGRNAGGIFQESRLLTQGITVGGNGDLAQMIVSNGGAVSSSLFMNIEQDGSLEISGPTSLVDVAGDVNVGTNISGLITFNGGRMIVGGLLHVGAGGSIEGNGTLIAPNRTVEIGGNIDSGLSPGALTFDADVELTATGRMHIEIGGFTPGVEMDQVIITGDATLGGTLLLDFIDGFAPRAGDEFKFLDVGGALSGEFANIDVRNLVPGFQFDLRPDAGGLTMVALNDGVFVPEPASAVLLGAAAAAIGFVTVRWPAAAGRLWLASTVGLR